MARKPAVRKKKTVSAPTSIGSSAGVRFRPISNGFLIIETRISKNGQFKEIETYSKKKPTIKF